ncbi:type IV toxin-antitoxin system YeeU family antitoxin [Escherichia coli]|nr:type IV toxin-antitoxin system YeeU family antitoxin [Escherichia coli]
MIPTANNRIIIQFPVCEADSLGSHGYIYLAIYLGEPPETGGMAR